MDPSGLTRPANDNNQALGSEFASLLSVLDSGKWIVHNAIDVSINPEGIKQVSQQILPRLESRSIPRASKRPTVLTDWSSHPMHPKGRSPEWLVNWIFFISLMNFSFWDDGDGQKERFMVRWLGKEWTGYWSLLAVFHRGISEGHSLTDPQFYASQTNNQNLVDIFRSDGDVDRMAVPLLDKRIKILRIAGQTLCAKYNNSAGELVKSANRSALKLISILIEDFPSFKDESVYNGRKVAFYKRAQIFCAELWAAFDGESYGQFDDIDQLTMFADYRVPQVLHSLETIQYSEHLENLLRSKTVIEHGSREEIEIRAISIVAIESLKIELATQLAKIDPSVRVPNAVELDFWLWDLAKGDVLYFWR